MSNETPQLENEEVFALVPPAEGPKKRRKKIDSSITEKDLVKTSKKKRAPKDLRTQFRALLTSVDIEQLKKPWMAQKSFRLIHTAEALQTWVTRLLADKSRHYNVFGESMPVVAIDTETIGLDTRIIVRWETEEGPFGPMMIPIYEVNTEIAGICLSADGIEGLYIPINHEDGLNIPREDATRILQPLLDASHHIYYNAKFDREILRITMGLNMREYPYFEDVQAINYINDPKADLGDKARGQYSGSSGGLKGLSKNVLGIEQIELDDLAVVSADFFNPETGKTTQRKQHCPFTWIPTTIALWYAAGDAICTWLLWEKLHPESRTRKTVHKIDHVLIDSLTWLERQRFLIDTDRQRRTVGWHQAKLQVLREELRNLALKDGYNELTEPDGTVLPENKFNPDSNAQLGKLAFEIKNLKVIKRSDKTGVPSFDSDVVEDLKKLYPDDEFLTRFSYYKNYVALHPENLAYDKRDNSARVYLRACVVAGGRLSATGGEFKVDGGFGLNIQAIKRIDGHLMWKVKGRLLEPDSILEADIEEYTEKDLHPSCFKKDKKAPGIVKNHIGQYLGYAVCLVPKCKTCAEKYGILNEKATLDANEVINLRCLFTAAKGWTYFTCDYGNIEMRAAANLSKEELFIREFLEGEGDFHSLTATTIFPEFTDPNTSKEVKKSLRSLAKIINFALLYGGTAYTIFENMKKQDPTITFEKANAMVEKYWQGVPAFDLWCKNKQAIAKNEMVCKTMTGRVINFNSAMESLGIHVPTKEDKTNQWQHKSLTKKHREAEKSGDAAAAAKYKKLADSLYFDKESGVRNASDYYQFIGKIQRVAVNIPVQGLAGDFMRMTLNSLYNWAALQEPDVQSVMRMHGTVHDEIDFAVKNEYVPFILPRITRMMKLRSLHKNRDWKVPIECDCEYGTSWDVEHHLTGDDSHKPAGWTEILGMETYIPDEFDASSVKLMVKRLLSEDDLSRAKVESWLLDNLHPRVHPIVKHVMAAENKETITKQLIATLQLHEYWTLDHVPDEEPEKLESLVQYEARMGLTEADRELTPNIGYIGAIPLSARVERPVMMKLYEDPQDDTVVNVVSAPVEEVMISKEEIRVADELLVEGLVPHTNVKFVLEEELESDMPKQEIEVTSQEDMLLDIPMIRKKSVEVTPEDIPVAIIQGPAPKKVEVISSAPKIRFLRSEEIANLREELGFGDKTAILNYMGKDVAIKGVQNTSIPSAYLMEIVNE